MLIGFVAKIPLNCSPNQGVLSSLLRNGNQVPEAASVILAPRPGVSVWLIMESPLILPSKSIPQINLIMPE
jgi:hypothetical protein